VLPRGGGGTTFTWMHVVVQRATTTCIQVNVVPPPPRGSTTFTWMHVVVALCTNHEQILQSIRLDA